LKARWGSGEGVQTASDAKKTDKSDF